MKKIAVLAVLFVFSASLQAAGFDSKEDARKYADKLVERFVQKEFQAGLNDAKKYWPIPAVEIDGLANQINQQWPLVDQRFGAAISKEFVKEARIGESFVRYYYLHKFENHAIYWQIDFYKPRDAWQINSIIFLDNLEFLYE